jgi:hypothetical protein
MSYYLSTLLWHAASFRQLLAAAVVACWIAKAFRLLLSPTVSRPPVLLRLSSGVVALAAFAGLVVASSYFMDRSFVFHLADIGTAGEGQAACVSLCEDSRPDSSMEPGGLEI